MLLTSQFAARFRHDTFTVSPGVTTLLVSLALLCSNVLFPAVKRGYLTLVVLILLPAQHIQPELSGSVLHSSPSRQGSISHHHFPITMDATGNKRQEKWRCRQLSPERSAKKTPDGTTHIQLAIMPGQAITNYHMCHVRGEILKR